MFSLHQSVMRNMSQELYEDRQHWACGDRPEHPTMNPYAKPSKAALDRYRGNWDLQEEIEEWSERANAWEHRQLRETRWRDCGIYAPIG